jgi:hypothetical protein
MKIAVDQNLMQQASVRFEVMQKADKTTLVMPNLPVVAGGTTKTICYEDNTSSFITLPVSPDTSAMFQQEL